MQLTRPAAFAGSFYPANRHQLDALIESYLDQATALDGSPKAIIVPHAGYIYSGPVAASAYACLALARRLITRVVLLGPSHRVGFSGCATSSALWFATPLGDIPIDRDACSDLHTLPFVQQLDQAHAQEHSLEVQLPFLQACLGSFSLVPVVVGEAKPEQVAALLERLWGGDETLIVISSDLSHYHGYATAKRMDAATSKAIESLKPDDIHFDDACGRMPISGLLLAAQRHGLSAKTIDLRNSGDTAGPKDQVVGYGAYIFAKPTQSN